MKENKLDIISRVVMIEKKPFYVVLWNHGREDYDSEEVLVRPCVSEDDLSKARYEYSTMPDINPDGLSYNPMKYYLVISGANFVGDVVDKGICKKISKQ